MYVHSTVYLIFIVDVKERSNALEVVFVLALKGFLSTYTTQSANTVFHGYLLYFPFSFEHPESNDES